MITWHVRREDGSGIICGAPTAPGLARTGFVGAMLIREAKNKEHVLCGECESVIAGLTSLCHPERHLSPSGSSEPRRSA